VSGWAYDQDISDTGDKPEKFGCRFSELNATIEKALKAGALKVGDANFSISDEKTPTVMSFLFFPFREEDPESQRSKVAKKLRSYYELPYFLPKSEMNMRVFNGRFEAFFGSKNSGVQPHSDDICSTIISSQFSGSKGWRLTLPVHAEELQRLNPDFVQRSDDWKNIEARMLAEHPIYDFVLDGGDQLIFPPGIIHGTKVVSDLCSMSLSSQFNDPKFVQYLKDFSGNLATVSHGVSSCFNEFWNYWMFGKQSLTSSGTEAENADECARLFKRFDLSDDGKITVNEVLERWEMDDEMGDVEVTSEVFRHAIRFIKLHDENGDDGVDRDEYVGVCKKLWTPVLKKMSLRRQFNEILEDKLRRMWRKLKRSPPQAPDHVTETMYGNMFPESKQYWKDICYLIDDDDDNEISDEEMASAQEAMDDYNFDGPETIPLALLLTGKENGLDALIKKGMDRAKMPERDEL
jgi:hypothetical protein